MIALFNRKGGTGKTTVTVHLGAGLSAAGRRVLLVDADPQAGLTISLGIRNPGALPGSLETALSRLLSTSRFEEKSEEEILHHPEQMDFLPAAPALVYLEGRLREEPEAMAVLLDGLRRDYDYILVDCDSSESALTASVLAAADSLIIPVIPGHLDVRSIDLTRSAVTRARLDCARQLEILGVLANMTNTQSRYGLAMAEELRQMSEEDLPVFFTEIPRTVRLAECSVLGQSIFAHDPKGKAAAAFRELTEEVLAYEPGSGEEDHPAGMAG